MTLEYKHLLGKRFELGRADCFSLTSDFFINNYGIKIKNYARPSDWNADDLDIIGHAHPREGFSKVRDWTLENLNPGDVLCLAIGSRVANHYAVYVGGNTIIHHLVNGLSKEEPLRPYFRKMTCYVLRHKDVEIQQPTKPPKTLLEIINERNKEHVAASV